ncbi:MAG: PcfJ domain-containing protein [Mariniblastus sp.]
MLPRPQGLRELIDQTIRAQLPTDPNARNTFLEFIHFVRAGSQLLAPANCKRNGDHDRLIARIRALLRISLNSSHWIRPIEGWYCDTAKARSLDDQFNSLVSYLFAKYPVPRFLNKVWFGNSWFDCRTGVSVFLKLGSGISPRKCGLPVRLTKSQTRHFMSAPDDLSLPQAIRWSQVKASGGSSVLARTILKTHLAEQQGDEGFWNEIVVWFCNAEQNDPSTLTPDEIVEMINFIEQHKFGPAHRILGYRVDMGPLQPEFSLRGRSIRWMRRHMVNWRAQLNIPNPFFPKHPRRNSRWEPLGINGIRIENDEGVLSIVELLTGDELVVEGGILKHCVGTYDRHCVRGNSSIWSVRLTRNEVQRRILTIELCPTRKTIVQAKGKSNSAPTEEARALVKQWVRQENLHWTNS